jgi:hypothetical protein
MEPVMTLLVINKEDLYHFSCPEDAHLWMDMNPTEKESVVLYPDDEFDEDFQEFLEDYYPLEIIMK